MKNSNIAGLLVVVVLVVAGIVYLSMGKAGPGTSALPAFDVVSTVATPNAGSSTASTLNAANTQGLSAADRLAAKAKQYEKAKELVAPSGFVNTGDLPITLSQYVGKKVILLDIMTYSCINCIRTFPYLNDWYKKYEDKGLVIIGIHTPEFDFEKNIDNVKAAMQKYGIKFPVVLDNDYGTWTAYKNLYWPRKYLIDIDGYVTFDHIGEGGYAETEEKIQDALKERADVLGLAATNAAVDMPVTIGPVEQGMPGQSPETYFGSARNEYFENGPRGVSLTDTFVIPKNMKISRLALGGTWKIESDHAENTAVPASIQYGFAAKRVYFVASADAPVKVDVYIDGSMRNTITVDQARLYDIYSGDSFGEHALRLEPQSKGLKAFTFTFGN